eukprot:Gb_41398 [translate_table: standard]
MMTRLDWGGDGEESQRFLPTPAYATLVQSMAAMVGNWHVSAWFKLLCVLSVVPGSFSSLRAFCNFHRFPRKELARLSARIAMATKVSEVVSQSSPMRSPNAQSKSGLTISVPDSSVLGLERLLNRRPALHNQVMKIREEEQHLDNGIREGKISPRDRLAIMHLTSQMRDVFVSKSRPAIPSPLGMKDRAQPISVWASQE